MVDFSTETLEAHVSEEAVGERMLRIAAERHKQMHEDKGEAAHVEIRQTKSKVSEKEEELIESFKKQDPLAKQDSHYNRLSAENMSKGNYGGSDAGAYGHSHSSAEASCKCGWRETAEGAMRETLEKEHGAYNAKALAGKGVTYQHDDNESLEGSLFQYSGPSDPGAYHQ